MRHGAKHSPPPFWRSHCAGGVPVYGLANLRHHEAIVQVYIKLGDAEGGIWRRGRSAAPVSNNDHEQGTVTPRQTPFITRCPPAPFPSFLVPLFSCPPQILSGFFFASRYLSRRNPCYSFLFSSFYPDFTLDRVSIHRGFYTIFFYNGI